MPTYDYRCEKCGEQFEVVQRMTDPKLTDCPQEDCEGTVKRLLGTGAGIIFKGSGFYETDYRSAEYKASAKKDSGESAPAKPDSGGKKESAGSGESKSTTTSSEKSSTPAKSTSAPASASS